MLLHFRASFWFFFFFPSTCFLLMLGFFSLGLAHLYCRREEGLYCRSLGIKGWRKGGKGRRKKKRGRGRKKFYVNSIE